MKLDQFLGRQLQDLIIVYKTLFRKTFGVTVILSFVCLLLIAVLHIYTGYNAESGGKISLLSYLWFQFSTSDGYKLVDMSKSVLLFVISFFSIALSRKIYRDKENINAGIGSFFDEMKPNDFVSLLLALVACLVVDYLVYQVNSYALSNIRNARIGEWVYYQLHFLRIYVPLLIFSFTSRLALSSNKSLFKLKECLFLLVSFWILNTLAYEFSLFVKSHVLQLLLAPVPVGMQLLVESALSLPLIAVLFLGYHSVITNSGLILQSDEAAEQLFNEEMVTSVQPEK
jgi:hypothetical protein